MVRDYARLDLADALTLVAIEREKRANDPARRAKLDAARAKVRERHALTVWAGHDPIVTSTVTGTPAQTPGAYITRRPAAE